jgi:hypothetical protein
MFPLYPCQTQTDLAAAAQSQESKEDMGSMYSCEVGRSLKGELGVRVQMVEHLLASTSTKFKL